MYPQNVEEVPVTGRAWVLLFGRRVVGPQIAEVVAGEPAEADHGLGVGVPDAEIGGAQKRGVTARTGLGFPVVANVLLVPDLIPHHAPLVAGDHVGHEVRPVA
jgi:hypothetical protein